MLLVAILFLLLGVLVKYGKMYFLIAGYNTMSKENKAKYDIEGIANVFRNTMFGMALLIIVAELLAAYLDYPRIAFYGFSIALLIGLPYLLIAANAKKYKK